MRAKAAGRASPVLRDAPGGTLRALPGNVIIRLDPSLGSQAVAAWLAASNLTQVGQLPIGDNVIVVASEPGLAALELANRLQQSGTVISAQPNWWKQAEKR